MHQTSWRAAPDSIASPPHSFWSSQVLGPQLPLHAQTGPGPAGDEEGDKWVARASYTEPPTLQSAFSGTEVFAEEASVGPTSSHPTRDEPGLESSHLQAFAHTGTPTSRHVCEGPKGLSLRSPHPSHTVPDRTPDGDASEQGSLWHGVKDPEIPGEEGTLAAIEQMLDSCLASVKALLQITAQSSS